MAEKKSTLTVFGDTGEDEEEDWGEDEFGKYRKNDEVWTMNEIRDHPLFMEDMPRDISENPHLMALQNLVYDGQTPEQMADHFRKLGNDAFRMVPATPISAQNALALYTKALEMECDNKALNSQLYSNRAAVSARLKEYERAVNDCRVAVRLDAENHKASYRASKASEALGLTSQALAFLEHTLRHKPDEKEVLDMKKRLLTRLDNEDKDRVAVGKVIAKAAEEQRFADLTATKALEERSVYLGPPMWDVNQYTCGAPPRPRLARDGEENGDGCAVVWPILMLYDETSQSDFVESFDDRCALVDQLELMFPADRPIEWDEEGKYTLERLIAYLECYAAEDGSNTRMIHLSMDESLQDQLKGRRVPPCLVLHVFVAQTPAHEHFCNAQGLASS